MGICIPENFDEMYSHVFLKINLIYIFYIFKKKSDFLEEEYALELSITTRLGIPYENRPAFLLFSYIV